MRKLFGTDGIRGIADTELTDEFCAKVGYSLAFTLAQTSDKKDILIGYDTRISSERIKDALVSGIVSYGLNAVDCGVLPTPAVAYLVKKRELAGGVVISASHNPFEFNGIKIFGPNGMKLSDKEEKELESMIEDISFKTAQKGSVTEDKLAYKDYIDHLKRAAGSEFSNQKVAIDCANGAASLTAKELFSSLNLDCHILSDSPNGKNINENCGSTHLDNLKKYVLENKMYCGIAFDGDADRCIFVDELGNEIDGDYIMAILALDLKNRGLLHADSVVGTTMTNLGFIHFCRENNISFEAAKVGDRYVLEKMLEHNFNFGGEQSGHIIFLDYATTGDGELTAVKLLSTLNARQVSLSSLSELMHKYPQVIVNLQVSDDKKHHLLENPDIVAMIKRAEKSLDEESRVIVRASGTEPLIRIMVEGHDNEQIQKCANEIAEFIQKFA